MKFFLPTTKKEMLQRGWDVADIILFSGDAYVDHPSFGVAAIGRILEADGYRVAIVPQPDWHGDLRDFKKLGRPRLFFGISPGCMDSMVNKYTAARRLRSEDAYSPNGRHDLRPEYPTIVYAQILRKLYPNAPIVLGGIEASLRRLAHYDYWKEQFKPSILIESQADTIVYGMGEKPITELANRCQQMIDSFHPYLDYNTHGEPIISRACFLEILTSPAPLLQSVTLHQQVSDIPGLIQKNDILLHSFEDILKEPKLHAENFRNIEKQSNRIHAQRLIQQTGDIWVCVNPPYPPMTTQEIDHCYDLPYTRLPHPRYKGKRIPAYEMIRFSVNLHRGCFGGCAFCTISAHQGKFIVSRSKESILREIKFISAMPEFKGYISDLGGPSANMYKMHGRNQKACEACIRPSCIYPEICHNLIGDHQPLLEIYKEVNALPGIKKSFISSGVRYDLLLHDWKEDSLNESARAYTRDLITNHVSGRLKVAPEHTSDKVLHYMRKPSFSLFKRFKSIYDKINAEANLQQQIIPYFISSHPGCQTIDMAHLALETKRMNFHLEQIQDFTPTPMTTATTAWATGYYPDTLEPIYSARKPEEKAAQRLFFFWYKPDELRRIEQELRKIHHPELIPMFK